MQQIPFLNHNSSIMVKLFIDSNNWNDIFHTCVNISKPINRFIPFIIMSHSNNWNEKQKVSIMNVFTNITSIFKKNSNIEKSSNLNFYALSSTLISLTLGLFAYTAYKLGQLDFSGLKLPIL